MYVFLVQIDRSQGDHHVLSLNVPEYCNARKNWLCKTSTRHRKNSKQNGIVAIGSCFAIIAALQYGVTTRESSVEKKPAHSDLPNLIYHPDLELTTSTEDRIMPYHVSPGGQEAKCELMSRKENITEPSLAEKNSQIG